MITERSSGYSLLELVMTLSLAALVLTLGLPSLGGLLADQRLRAETDALFHAVHLARKASVVRRRAITLCASADGLSCRTDGDWSEGWIMFEEQSAAATGSREPNEPILRHHEVEPSVRLVANRRSFSFRSTHLRATNGTVRVCDAADRARPRAVVISYTGRPRVAREDARGRPYDCALS